MNKGELIARMAKSDAKLTQSVAASALNAALDAIAASLEDGEPVQIIGFGTFYIRQNAARTGRNPQTGDVMQIPASRSAGLKQGKALRDRLNS